MGSVMESKLTPEQYKMIRKVLIAQTEAHGTVELPIVEDMLRNRKCKSVLDVGCGEGTFLLRLADAIKGARFLGIDLNEMAIAELSCRVPKQSTRNVKVATGFFDGSFERKKYDAIITRYTIQHSSKPQAFIRAAFDRIKRQGVLIAIESLDAYTDCHVHDDVWQRFRIALDAIHQRVGSNNNMGKSLALLMRKAGFKEIRMQAVFCSPATVGWKKFSAVIQASANLAFGFFPDLFDQRLCEDMGNWLGERKHVEDKDPYLCTAIASATKP